MILLYESTILRPLNTLKNEKEEKIKLLKKLERDNWEEKRRKRGRQCKDLIPTMDMKLREEMSKVKCIEEATQIRHY